MGLLFGLLTVLGDSSAKTIDKLNFRRNQIGAQQLMLLVFVGMTATLLTYLGITRPALTGFNLATMGLLLCVGLVSFAGNLLDYLSLKVNDLSLRQPLLGLEPAVAGLIGFLVFPGERKPLALIAFALSAVVVCWGVRLKQLHAVQKRGLLLLLFAVLSYAVMPTLYKLTLAHMAPVYVATMRTALVFVLSLIVFRVGKAAYTRSKVGHGLLSGTLYAATTIFNLLAIVHLGVVETMLLLLLQPGLIYLGSHFIFKEKVKREQVIASALLAGIGLLGLI